MHRPGNSEHTATNVEPQSTDILESILQQLSNYDRWLQKEGERINRARKVVEKICCNISSLNRSDDDIKSEDALHSAATPLARVADQPSLNPEFPIFEDDADRAKGNAGDSRVHYLNDHGLSDNLRTSGTASKNRLNVTAASASDPQNTPQAVRQIDMVSGVLNKHGAMTNPQIIEAVLRDYGRVLSGESLSVQLSRWATAGQLQRNGRLWKMVGHGDDEA